jgi:hypothetical protein
MAQQPILVQGVGMTARQDERRPPGPPKYRPTTEETAKIATLAAGGWSDNRISKAVGRSRKMVKNVLADPEVRRTVASQKIELSEIFLDKGRAIVTSIGPKDIDKASLQQKAISAGVMVDKALLLAGEPTENIDVRVLMDVVDAIRERKVVEQENLQRAMRLPHLPPVIEAVESSTPPAEPPKTSRQPASQGELEIQYFPVPLKAPAENG